MKNDTTTAGNAHDWADIAVVAVVGWTAAAAFDTSPWLTIPTAWGILWSVRPGAEGKLWQRPNVWLAFLSLLLLGVLSHGSSYRHGVVAGFDAASAALHR